MTSTVQRFSCLPTWKTALPVQMSSDFAQLCLFEVPKNKTHTHTHIQNHDNNRTSSLKVNIWDLSGLEYL